jgi:hypothetical protein
MRLFATKCHIHDTSMSKAIRAKLHHAINALTGTQVASIVRNAEGREERAERR